MVPAAPPPGSPPGSPQVVEARYPGVLQLIHVALAPLICAQFGLIYVLRQLQSVPLSQMAGAVDEPPKRTRRQSEKITETVAAIGNVRQAVLGAAENPDEAGNVVAAAQTEAQRSNAAVHDAIAAMHDIESSSDQIFQMRGRIVWRVLTPRYLDLE
jgi:hypothetical protein